MASSPPRTMDGPKLQTKMSTWTPLNNQLMNDKIFEERRALLGKWFDKWTDSQRRRILGDLLARCSLAQQKFCAKQLQDRIPTEALDFTTRLPRVLSLYIFSFLDPRSLCRCAQVSWYWKYLSELDQLWMLKCLRFGWYINFSPTPFEQGIWKKHYIEMVKELRITRPKSLSRDDFVVIDVQPVRSSVPEAKLSVPARRTSKEKKELPPWRSTDRHPTDTIRFNYLDNYDPIEQARQARKKGGGETPDLSRQAAERKKRASRGSNKLHKAKSLKSEEYNGLGDSSGLDMETRSALGHSIVPLSTRTRSYVIHHDFCPSKSLGRCHRCHISVLYTELPPRTLLQLLSKTRSENSQILY